VATCFSNPKYGIAPPDANKPTPTEIYIFRDPSNYYKLELTSPYLEVVKLNRPLPNAAAMRLDYGTGGDALDWTLAMSICFLFFLMVLLVCQQMGNHYVEFVFKCQRRFFNPRGKHDDDEESFSGVQSGSHFFFGKSGIPLSMGGKQSSYSPLQNRGTFQDVIVEESCTDDEKDLHPTPPKIQQAAYHHRHQQPTRLASPLELEMVNFGAADHSYSLDSGRSASRRDSFLDHSPESSHESSEEGEIPERLLRNPDFVELPSLKSKSKVAIPVGSTGVATSTNGGGGSSHGTNGALYTAQTSSFADGSVRGSTPETNIF